ncbi:Component of IIS longevity pathway SMK-1 family protein [Theileria parva strain Muguga]|uniref:Component of IIS longevity pathway SMK-1 family protein n=1 Tax=Theileria parva strain Muguga TaxID=333668 RepID=UPI001C620464|nr:Component of IIS longevity pathway SMK-1 family protein [Theileria parva strain Muguga]KAF5153163.1 Component of IIS longevity pathway SMK-1 family protein [Theileria parva strain Muguga]
MTDEELCDDNRVGGLEFLYRGDAAFTYNLDDEPGHHPVNSLPSSYRTVKFYEIGPTSETWVDKGTGFCFFDDPDSENPKLLVSLDHYGIKTLFSTYIKDNTDYLSQAESIIIWHDGSDKRIYRALSFQNIVGHNACWKYMRNFVDDFDAQTTVSSVSALLSERNSEFRVLPTPTVTSIPKIESNMQTYLCPGTMSDGLFLDLYDKKWLKDLFAVLDTCILSNDIATASSISSILLKLVLKWCGSLELMHIFVSDDIFFHLLKAFEYDPDLMKHNLKMEHVKFFKEFVRHHEVVQITNTSFYQLIQANYRINYLKDVILPRHLDEFSIQRINSTVFANMAEIMNIILNEENNFFEHLKPKLATNYMAPVFLRELLLVARSTNLISHFDRNSLILMVRNYKLLNELTGYLDGSAHAITIYNQTLLPLNLMSNQYYDTIKLRLTTDNIDNNESDLNDSNTVDTLTTVSPDNTIVDNGENNSVDENKTNGSSVILDRDELRPNLLCTGRYKLIEPLNLVIEIFHICQEIFPAIVRSSVFIDAEVNKTPKLFINLCNILLRESNEGLQSQTREIVSRLLDPKSMDLPDRDEICNIFYDKGVLDYLMTYLDTNVPEEIDKKEEDDDDITSTPKLSAKNNLTGSLECLNNDIFAGISFGSIDSYCMIDYKFEDSFESEDEHEKFIKEIMKENMLSPVTGELRVNAILNIMEILSLCAREHKHRFKLRVQSQKIPLRVIKSAMSPYDKFLVIGSIKFIKVCIQMKDTLVDKHIIKYNVLRYVMWILRYKVDSSYTNGSMLESACLSLLSTIESTDSDLLVRYLFKDSFCSSAMEWIKGQNKCFQDLFGNLKRFYNNKFLFDEKKWLEGDDDEFELKNKLMQEGIQEQLISLYNTNDDDQWVLNKKHQSVIDNFNTLERVGILEKDVETNNKIMVKLKPNTDENSLAEEFLLDMQDSKN